MLNLANELVFQKMLKHTYKNYLYINLHFWIITAAVLNEQLKHD